MNTCFLAYVKLNYLKSLFKPIIMVLLFMLIGFSFNHLYAQTVEEPIYIGPKAGNGLQPVAIEVDETNNLVYIVNAESNSVSVIDGQTEEVVGVIDVETIDVSRTDTYKIIGVNSVTSKIYVANTGTSSVSVIDGQSKQVIDTIRLGSKPRALEVCSKTNRIYVANREKDSVSVINGDSDEIIALVEVGNSPITLTVNTTTNMVYVADLSFSDNISVINGDTFEVEANLTIGSEVEAMAVNPITNRVYIASLNDILNNITILDGDTNEVVGNITVGLQPASITIDTLDNRIYVANFLGNSVTVIDGDTNNIVSTIKVSPFPRAIGVNSVTKRLYVANTNSGGLTNESHHKITVIDTNIKEVINTIQTGVKLSALTVNPDTNTIYATTKVNDSLAVVDGETKLIVKNVTVGNEPLGVGVNKNTGRVYVANSLDETVSIVDGNNNEISEALMVDALPHSVAVNDVTDTVYISHSTFNTGLVSIIDGIGDVTVKTIKDFTSLGDIEVNSDTNIVYVVNNNSGLKVIDVDQNDKTSSIFTNGNQIGVGVHPAVNRVYSSQLNGNFITVIDGETDDIVNRIDHEFSPWAIGVNPNTNRVYITNIDDNSVSVIDADEDIVVDTLPTGKRPIAISVDKKNNIIYVANELSGDITVIQDELITGAYLALSVTGESNVTASNIPFTQKINVENKSGDGFIGLDAINTKLETNEFSSDITIMSADTSLGSCEIVNGETAGSTKVECDLGTIPLDGELEIDLNVNANIIGEFTLTSSVSSEVFDPIELNNHDDFITSIAGVDIEVSVESEPSIVGVGDIFTHKIQVINNDIVSSITGVDATDVTLQTSDFETNVMIEEIVTNQGSCEIVKAETFDVKKVECDLETILLGEEVQVDIKLKSMEPGIITTEVSASSIVIDVNALNNKDSIISTITGADILVDFSGEPEMVETGDVFTYTIDVLNDSSNVLVGLDATDVKLDLEKNNNDVKIESIIPDQGSCKIISEGSGASSKAECDLGTIPFGEKVEIDLKLTTEKQGLVTVSAVAAYPGFDPDESNNQQSVTTEITVKKPVELKVNPTGAGGSIVKSLATVTALDKSGAPLPGVFILSLVSGRGVIVEPSSAVTDANGEAEFSFKFRYSAQNAFITFINAENNLSASIVKGR